MTAKNTKPNDKCSVFYNVMVVLDPDSQVTSALTMPETASMTSADELSIGESNTDTSLAASSNLESNQLFQKSNKDKQAASTKIEI